MADETTGLVEETGIDQIGKIIVAGVVFGMVVKNAVNNGLVAEVKNFKLSTLVSGAVVIVPKIVNALKGNQAVAMLEGAGDDQSQA